MTTDIFGASDSNNLGENGLISAENDFFSAVNKAERKGGKMSNMDLLEYQKVFNGYQAQVQLQATVTKGMADTLKTIIRAIG
jgi:hypothetical protein